MVQGGRPRVAVGVNKLVHSVFKTAFRLFLNRKIMQRYYKKSDNGDNPYIDLKPYHEIILSHEDKLAPGDKAYRMALLTLYGGLNRCFNASMLAWAINVKRSEARQAVKNLKASKIWIQKNKKQRHEFIKEMATMRPGSRSKKVFSFIVAFWADVLVAEGQVVKRKGKYGLSEWRKKEKYSNSVKRRLRSC